MTRVGALVGIMVSILVAACGSVAPSVTIPPASGAAPQARVDYEIVPIDGREPTAPDVDTIRSVVEQRLIALGAVDPTVSVEGDRIVIKGLDPGDLAVVRSLVSAEGRLDFIPLGSESIEAGQLVDPSAHPPLFGGDQIESASLGSDQNGRPAIDFVLRDDGRANFATYTTASIGDWFAITLDDRVLSAPVINSAILDGNVEITGAGLNGFALDEARRIVTILRFGSLPFPIREVTGTDPP